MASTGVLLPSNYPDHFQDHVGRLAHFTACDAGDVVFVPLLIAPSLPTDGKVKRYRWWDEVRCFVSFTTGTVNTVTAKVVELTTPLSADWSFTAAIASGSAAGSTDVSGTAVAVTEQTLLTINPPGTTMDGNRVTPGKILALMLLFGGTSSGGAVSVYTECAFRTRAQ
jgi:hypothetical protein